jgi:ABC-type polysaccharide/polyol phosphate transport system ATPase subunit
MTQPAVELSNVSKVYRRGAERTNLRAALPGELGRKPPRDGHWALRDLSMLVRPQEIVGIIGPNGAGKSTLLKLLARVIAPTSGRVVTRGRVASLIELGVGFHPDLTGADNVRFSAAVLGMSRQQIRRHFDAIAEFAGIQPFMDTPVKRYSSGMLARLGFAVASHLDANIVLVDEVLSVGDVEFQRRGFRRMEELRSEGATLLLVTHNLWLVPEICQRALRLEQGRIVDEGDPGEVVERYQASSAERFFGDDSDDSSSVLITKYRLSSPVILPGEPLDLEFDLDVARPIPNSRATIVITTPQGFHAAGTDVAGSGEALSKPGTWRMRGHLDSVSLSEGTYRVLVTVVEQHAGVLLTHSQASASLSVKSERESPQYGLVHLDSNWDVDSERQ